MIEFLDRLPDHPPDIDDGSRHHDFEDSPGESDRQDEERAEAFGALNPLMRRSFEALAAGLDKLAQSAADLCDPKRRSWTPGELESCLEIGRSMRRLLDRASALIEPAETEDADAAPARNAASSRPKDARSPPGRGEPGIVRS
jgi:hypothetical protein